MLELRHHCQLTLAQVEAMRLPEPRFMYMTIDDVPDDGLDITLDALLVGQRQETKSPKKLCFSAFAIYNAAAAKLMTESKGT